MFGSGNKGSKVILSDVAYEKATKAAAVLGCPVEALLEKVIVAEADKILASSARKDASPEEVAAITQKLAGLGYLD